MKFLNCAILMIFVFVNYSEGQTAIVAKLTKYEIFVGADSRRVGFRVNGYKRDTIFDSVCKIHSSGKYNWASSGLMSDVGNDEAKYASIKEDFHEMVKLYTNNFGYRIAGSMDSIQRSDPWYYLQAYEENRILAQTIFFGFENDTPYLKLFQFVQKNKNWESPSISIYTKNVAIDSSIAIGHVRQINWMLKDPTLWKNGIVNGIKNFIDTAAKNEPFSVGGEIDIAEVSQLGLRWIQKKKICK